MEISVKTTGDFGIGIMIHSVHMTDDVPRLNQFYEEVFGGLMYMGVDEPGYSPVEDRYAGLLVISDLCIETMAPKMPVDPTKPVGKFFTKFGKHLHSVGYKVDDLVGLGNSLIKQGVYVGAPGGGALKEIAPDLIYFYPTPRDMQGLMVELCKVEMRNDPRQMQNWSSQRKLWELSHPLGIKRLAYVTLGVKDLDAAVDTYVTKIQAVPVSDGIDDASRSRYAILQLGNCLLQLAQPLDDSSDLGAHVAKWGNMIYGITFKVRDLDSAEAWLEKKQIRSSRPGPGVLAANPEDCFGAPYFFTSNDIPNDPLDR